MNFPTISACVSLRTMSETVAFAEPTVVALEFVRPVCHHHIHTRPVTTQQASHKSSRVREIQVLTGRTVVDTRVVFVKIETLSVKYDLPDSMNWAISR